MVRPKNYKCQISSVYMYGRWVLLSIWFPVVTILALMLSPFFWRKTVLGKIYASMLAGGVNRILNIRFEVKHPERLAAHRPCVFVCNHQSNLDVLTLASIYPSSTVLIGKKELMWFPLFGFLFWAAGNVLVNRGNRAAASASLEKAIKFILRKKLAVWIFPEGTRNRGSLELLPFKKGAALMAIRAQVPIVPVVHDWLPRYYDPRRNRFGDAVIRVHVLAPVPTAGFAVEQAGDLTAQLREAMQKELSRLIQG
jgi:1-acyl-sn-glycerol-3-phosphate acyltransferase